MRRRGNSSWWASTLVGNCIGWRAGLGFERQLCQRESVQVAAGKAFIQVPEVLPSSVRVQQGELECVRGGVLEGTLSSVKALF
eukprot:scaffold14603_cov140-Isochrysis_galbana.AAC.1